MTYEVYTPTERRRMTFRKAGIDVIDPSKETRRRKLGRKVREQSKAAVRAGIKAIRGTPEGRKARREKFFKKLKEGSRQPAGAGALGLSPSNQRSRQRGRRRTRKQKQRRGYPKFY